MASDTIIFSIREKGGKERHFGSISIRSNERCCMTGYRAIRDAVVKIVKVIKKDFGVKSIYVDIYSSNREGGFEVEDIEVEDIFPQRLYVEA